MINSRSVNDLLPGARDKAREFKQHCKAFHDIDVLIYCTYRDVEQQNALYAQGRTTNGRKVTNARGGKSWHQYRVAWDCVPMIGGKAAWGDKAAYKLMGAVAKTLGIEWAGDWRSFKETAHFQYTKSLPMAHFKAGGGLR